jgi:hypothetical protein
MGPVLKQALVVFCGALLSSCAAAVKPKVTVLKQAEPNPLVGATTFQVADVTYEGFTFEGKTEEEWLAKEDADYRAGWKGNKEGLTERIFKQMLVEAGDSLKLSRGAEAAAGQFVLAINLDRYVDEAGVMAGSFHGTLRVKDSTGQVVDEVQLPRRQGGGIPSLALNTFAIWTAADTVEYVDYCALQTTAFRTACP